MTITRLSETPGFSITDQLTPDVLAGMQLYAEETMKAEHGFVDHATCTKLAERWMALFRGNPYGSGRFAIAKWHEDVVGFFATIPFEMQLNSRDIPAGKSEFLVVAEPFRRAIIDSWGTSVAQYLFDQLRAESLNERCEVILAVPSENSDKFCQRGGDTCILSELSHYTLDVQPSASAVKTDWFRSLAGREFPAMIHIDKVDRFYRRARAALPNSLVSPCWRMLEYRFPPHSFLKLSLLDPFEGNFHFVFSKPRREHPCRLLYWSALPESFEPFVALLMRVLDEMMAVSCSQLLLELDRRTTPTCYDLERLGFKVAHSSMRCYLHSLDHRFDEETTWAVCRAHMGFYQDAATK